MKSTRTAQLAFGFVALLALTRADFDGVFTVAAEKFEVLARRGSLEDGAPTRCGGAGAAAAGGG